MLHCVLKCIALYCTLLIATNTGCVDSADKKAPTAQDLHNSEAASFVLIHVSIIVPHFVVNMFNVYLLTKITAID